MYTFLSVSVYSSILVTSLTSSRHYTLHNHSMSVFLLLLFFFQAEDGIRYHCVTGVQTCFFFFQAEDGIRDHCVTGVQTCALPIPTSRCAPRKRRRPPRTNPWLPGG